MNKVEILEKALDNVLDRRLKALDLLLESLGSPDKALGKPYATLTGGQLIHQAPHNSLRRMVVERYQRF